VFPLAFDAARRARGRCSTRGRLLQAVSHALAKAAMFMSAGLIALSLGHDRMPGWAASDARDRRAARVRPGAGVSLVGPAAERRLCCEVAAAVGGRRHGPVVVGGRDRGWRIAHQRYLVLV